MTHDTEIRRRRDGSIDTAHYMAQGRDRRSSAARDMLPARPAERPGLLAGLVMFLALLPFWPGQG